MTKGMPGVNREEIFLIQRARDINPLSANPDYNRIFTFILSLLACLNTSSVW